MDWRGLPPLAAEYYGVTATWAYNNPSYFDLIVVSVVVGSLVLFARRTMRMRRLMHRIRWGVGMKKSKNREAYERGLISFGIQDAIMEAVWRGDMTEERGEGWCKSFAEDYGMTELLPKKITKEQLKKNINKRIQLWERLKVYLPKGAAYAKPDPNYKPVIDPVVRTNGLNGSKYA